MHVLLNTEEFDQLNPGHLPDGTTLVESSEAGKPLRAYVVEGYQFKVTRDFVEEDRPWKNGEHKKFINGKTKEDVLNFFLSHNDAGPHREWQAMDRLEYDFFSFMKHAGRYRWLEDDETRFNIFRLSLNRDSNLKKAKREIAWVLEKIANFYPNVNPIYIDIFEHTLSEYGTYHIDWDRENKFDIVKTTYGRPEVIKTLSSLEEMLEYVSKHHYYE